MQKTTHYQLNKPEAGDPMRLADFNENADLIDAALNEVRTLAATEKMLVGSFVGDDTVGSTVTLGFTPKVILIMTPWDDGTSVCLATADFGYYAYKTTRKETTTRVVENGVYINGNLNNSKSNPNHYIAFL